MLSRRCFWKLCGLEPVVGVGRIPGLHQQNGPAQGHGAGRTSFPLRDLCILARPSTVPFLTQSHIPLSPRGRWEKTLHPGPDWQEQLCRTLTMAADPVTLHKRRLAEWFSHLPTEEKHYGPSFTFGALHVHPVIREGPLELNEKPLILQSQQMKPKCQRIIGIQNLFDSDASGRWVKNVVLYGTVGTGKSTLIKKMVMDWCHGGLPQFDLVLPFSCEDLSQSSTPISLKRLIVKKYVYLRELLPRLGAADFKVLFVFNGMEWLNLDFRLAGAELCSDLDEPQTPATILVNLIRSYMLPEASIVMTTRPSALSRIPGKFVGRYVQICGFSDTDLQKMYFQMRLSDLEEDTGEMSNILEMLSRNLEYQNQLAKACFLPSYCWLTCATLHFLYMTKGDSLNQTLTGIYTSFLRLNFGGEILDITDPSRISMMHYVTRSLGKLAYEGYKKRQTKFSDEDLQRVFEVEMKSEEELNLLTVFQRDVKRFFLSPCMEPGQEQMFMFTISAMQEYLAALFVVMGEHRSALQRIGSEVSEAIGKASEDLTAIMNILAKFLPIRVFALFNLVKIFPRLYGKISGKSRDGIAQTMAVEMFREEDSFNDDVLDQINFSILGQEGPMQHPSLDVQKDEAFELFPIFIGGLLAQRNRAMLDQLGCSIKNFAAFEIAKAMKKYLLKHSQKKQPPSEMMDFLFLLYEFQNDRFTSEVVRSLKVLDLSTVKMTPIKCHILASVMGTSGQLVTAMDLTSCHLDPGSIKNLVPIFRRCESLDLQMNSLGPAACRDIRDMLLDKNCAVKTLRLCNNPITAEGVVFLGEALSGNESLTHLSLLHTSLSDRGAEILVEHLAKNTHLQELNLAYNSITDNAALALVEVAKRHPSMQKVHLYFNNVSEEGRQALHELRRSRDGVQALVSLAEGTDVSQYWSLILNVVTKNVKGWDHERLERHLRLLLEDLQCSRRQTYNPWKKIKFLRVENKVQKVLQKIQKESM
ncbi:NLR family member X1 [Ambystoma mexicanum]|uniref:NLR family member X1 n=1 Tax=Ambystoma mexicanum TaxID=8296 RepID=UPI0037E73A7C